MPSCGEAVVALLEQSGAETVFGIPGVHTLEIYRGLSASRLRHIAPCHEQGAAFMADGWARVTGRPGVCILISGPGLTNAMTPIAQAYRDSIPMLVISGAVAEHERGQGEIHDLPDQQGLMSRVTAFSHTVSDPAKLLRCSHVARMSSHQADRGPSTSRFLSTSCGSSQALAAIRSAPRDPGRRRRRTTSPAPPNCSAPPAGP